MIISSQEQTFWHLFAWIIVTLIPFLLHIRYIISWNEWASFPAIGTSCSEKYKFDILSNKLHIYMISNTKFPIRIFFNCCFFHQHYLVGSKVHGKFRVPERKFVKPCAEQFWCTYISSGQESASCVQFWNLALVPKIFKETRTIIYQYEFKRQFLKRYLIIKDVNSFLSTLNTLLETRSEWPKDC